MTLLSIRTVPDQILKNPCSDVMLDEFNDHLKVLVSDMIETMRSHDGLGLAAPQIGISKKIIVVENVKNLENSATENYQKVDPYVLINPVIIFKSNEKEYDWEGCLSIPNLIGLIKRSINIKISGFTIDGQFAVVDADGLMARAFQHEISHLDGILITKIARELRNIDNEKDI
jgi:peptide deformylase